MERCSFSLHHLHRCSKMCEDARFLCRRCGITECAGDRKGEAKRRAPLRRRGGLAIAPAQERRPAPRICPNGNKSACRIMIIPPRRLFRHDLHSWPAVHSVGHHRRGRRPRRPERPSLAIWRDPRRNAARNREYIFMALLGSLCHHAQSYPSSVAAR